MKARIIAVGQKMPSWVNAGFNAYHKRMGGLLDTQLVELPAAKRGKNPSAATIDQYCQAEGELILQAHKSNNREQLICLDVQGKMLSTEKLADKLANIMQQGDDVAFVIGGADGLSADVLNQANFKWSLSALTLPHPLVRVVLIEQLYRAMSILNNHPYHRG